MVNQEPTRREEVDFASAIEKHFSLPTVVNCGPLEAGRFGGFYVDLRIHVTTEQMAAIVARMGAKAPAGEQEPVSAHFDPPATDDDLKRFAYHPCGRYDADTLNSIAADARRRLESAVRRGLRSQ